jgi:hypothetical protein
MGAAKRKPSRTVMGYGAHGRLHPSYAPAFGVGREASRISTQRCHRSPAARARRTRPGRRRGTVLANRSVREIRTRRTRTVGPSRKPSVSGPVVAWLRAIPKAWRVAPERRRGVRAAGRSRRFAARCAHPTTRPRGRGAQQREIPNVPTHLVRGAVRRRVEHRLRTGRLRRDRDCHARLVAVRVERTRHPRPTAARVEFSAAGRVGEFERAHPGRFERLPHAHHVQPDQPDHGRFHDPARARHRSRPRAARSRPWRTRRLRTRAHRPGMRTTTRPRKPRVRRR